MPGTMAGMAQVGLSTSPLDSGFQTAKAAATNSNIVPQLTGTQASRARGGCERWQLSGKGLTGQHQNALTSRLGLVRPVPKDLLSTMKQGLLRSLPNGEGFPPRTPVCVPLA